NLVYQSWGEGIGVGGHSHGNVISHNTIWDTFSCGLYPSYAPYNNTFTGNFIYFTGDASFRNPRGQLGICAATESGPPGLKLENNTFTNNIVVGEQFGFYWFRNPPGDGSFTNNVIANNTFVNNEISFAIDTKSSNAGNVLRNNIFYHAG